MFMYVVGDELYIKLIKGMLWNIILSKDLKDKKDVNKIVVNIVKLKKINILEFVRIGIVI